MSDIKVFISYAHEDENYKEWVKSFADKLIKHGINVTLDQYDLHLTDNITHFMEKSIAESNFVILLLSKNYITKANERVGGVGYEIDLTTGEIFVNKSRSKFVPILVKVDFNSSPSFLKGFSSLKIDNLFSYDETYLELYAYITNQPLQKKPSIGKIIPIDELKSQTIQNKIDIESLCKKYNLFNYAHTKLVLTLTNFNGKKINELFPIFQKYFLKSQSNQYNLLTYYPYILNPKNKTRNSPFIEYVSENYIPLINNWKLIDRISFADNVITYDSLELSDQLKIMYTSRVPFISSLFLFEFLKKLYTSIDKRESINLHFEITGNKDILYSTNNDIIQQSVFAITENKFEMYKLDMLNNNFKIDDFGLDEVSIRNYFDKCISLFVSDDPVSSNPFMSIVDCSYFDIINDVKSGNYHY